MITPADAPWRGNGDLIKIWPVIDGMTAAESRAMTNRFNAKVVDDPAGHRLWTATLNDEGYARFYLGESEVYAHRLAWVLANGRDPLPGYTIDHECRTRNCVNSAHLRELTMRENALAGNSPAAFSAAKLFCASMHPLIAGHPNLYIRPDGARGCRACRSAAQRKAKAARLFAEHVAAYEAALAAGETPDPVEVHVRGRTLTAGEHRNDRTARSDGMTDDPTPDQHRNRAQRRALQFKQGPRRTPFGGYPTPGVVRARGTSGRGHRATVITRDNLQMRGPDEPETTDQAPPAV